MYSEKDTPLVKLEETSRGEGLEICWRRRIVKSRANESLVIRYSRRKYLHFSSLQIIRRRYTILFRLISLKNDFDSNYLFSNQIWSRRNLYLYGEELSLTCTRRNSKIENNTAIYTQRRRKSLRGKARGNDETKELEAERFNERAGEKEEGKKRSGKFGRELRRISSFSLIFRRGFFPLPLSPSGSFPSICSRSLHRVHSHCYVPLAFVMAEKAEARASRSEYIIRERQRVVRGKKIPR